MRAGESSVCFEPAIDKATRLMVGRFAIARRFPAESFNYRRSSRDEAWAAAWASCPAEAFGDCQTCHS